LKFANIFHLDVSTLSRNVERMKARGWLEVVPDEDGRSQPFRLTPQGRKLLEKAIPAWSDAQQQVKKVLGDAFVEQLKKLACVAPLLTQLHGLVQLLHERIPKNFLTCCLRVAPGRNRLFQKLASLRVRRNGCERPSSSGTLPTSTSLHAFDVAAEGRYVEMEMFGKLQSGEPYPTWRRRPRMFIWLTFQVERPQGVVVRFR